MRAGVVDGFLAKSTVAWENIFPPAIRVVVGDIINVGNENSVAVQTQDGPVVVKYDYLIFSTGTSYDAFKSNAVKRSDRTAEGVRLATDLARAQSALVIGAGSVGSELAAEIKHYYPNK